MSRKIYNSCRRCLVGMGLLHWRSPSGHTIKRHLLVTKAILEFDEQKGIITLSSSPEGHVLNLEQDMLEINEQPPKDSMLMIQEAIQNHDGTFWDKTFRNAVLGGWVRSISPDGTYEDQETPPSKPATEIPIVYWAPSLILRKRTDRSLLRIYQEIEEQLDNGGELQSGILQIVDESSMNADPEIEDGYEHSIARGIGPILFPLPYNKEQLRIIQELTRKKKVLVQGPPGTGKSHTIANLICHLLANGNRILVTSHTGRALEVLKDKIPPNLSKLCVLLLGGDREGLRSLEDSVQTITDKQNRWDHESNQQVISDLTQRIDALKREESTLVQRLQALRESETYKHSASWLREPATAKEIANQLRENEVKLSWLKDIPDPNSQPPFSNQRLVELLEFARQTDIEAISGFGNRLHDLEQLPNPSELCSIVWQKQRLESVLLAEHLEPDPALATLDLEFVKHLEEQLHILVDRIERLQEHIEPWAAQAAKDILGDRDRVWKIRHENTQTALKRLRARPQDVDQLRVLGVDGVEIDSVLEDAEILSNHLSTGKSLGFWIFRPSVVKERRYLMERVTVNGKLCTTSDTLEVLRNWLKCRKLEKELSDLWSDIVNVKESGISTLIARYEDLCEPLSDALDLYPIMDKLREEFSTSHLFPRVVWHDITSIRSALSVLQQIRQSILWLDNQEALQALSDRTEAMQQDLVATVAGLTHIPSVRNLLACMDNLDVESYQTILQDLMNEFKMVEDWNLLNLHIPQTIHQLKQNLNDLQWNERFQSFSQAWSWAKANAWFEEFSSPQEENRVSTRLDVLRKEEIPQTIAELVEARAWSSCFQRLQEPERRSLIAWTKAMKRLGKGTGKYAQTHRREAQRHMENSRPAIPAWIMPMYQVAQTIQPGKDVFDVVIVDEASQSGVDALFLLYLAKKVLVVGDDKQISPENPGRKREPVMELQERYLSDFPQKDLFSLDQSLFDLTETFFQGRIRLREHFRCMPEIIEYSNRLCYQSEPLVPLKPFGSNRLAPTIITRFVEGGYREGSSARAVNKPEAEALAEQVYSCCQSPLYDGKTMGVISLQGKYQAREIEELLLDSIGPKEMEARSLVCGDAYAFQGNERDVIFLSMVAAPTGPTRIGVLSKSTDKKRFNVAISRAKEQIWLFHSASLNDLSQNVFGTICWSIARTHFNLHLDWMLIFHGCK